MHSFAHGALTMTDGRHPSLCKYKIQSFTYLLNKISVFNRLYNRALFTQFRVVFSKIPACNNETETELDTFCATKRELFFVAHLPVIQNVIGNLLLKWVSEHLQSQRSNGQAQIPNQ